MRTLFFILALYAVLKALVFFHSPSTLSLDEIELLSQLNIWIPIGLPIHKIFAGAVGCVVLFALWFFLRRNNYSEHLQIGAMLTLTTAPFFLLVTNFLGPSLYFLLGIALVLVLPNRAWSVIILAVMLVLSIMRFGLKPVTLAELSAIADLDLLFFDAKSLPLFLTIPASGLFVFSTIIPFGVGLYSLLQRPFLVEQIKRGVVFIGYVLFVVFFLQVPTYVRLVPFLIVTALISGHGYSYMINASRGRFRRTIIFLVIALFTLPSVAYSSEILINHFDKKTSFEWGVAETRTLEWLNQHSFRYFATAESDKLMRYYKYYSHNIQNSIELRTVELSQISSICSKGGNACILKGHEMEKLKRNKTETDFIGRFEDGLEAYYVIIQ